MFARSCALPSQTRRVVRSTTRFRAAASIELVHSFSVVHDDLPAMDDDVERRGRESTWVAFGEGVALLAGDALLAEALQLALSYESPEIARELVDATLGMIGGQYRDIAGDDADLEELHRLKTGRLFVAAVRMGLEVAAVPEAERASWLAFGDEIGLLFQVVDDLLDGDGYSERLGREGAERLADETAERARAHLEPVASADVVLRDARRSCSRFAPVGTRRGMTRRRPWLRVTVQNRPGRLRSFVPAHGLFLLCYRPRSRLFPFAWSGRRRRALGGPAGAPPTSRSRPYSRPAAAGHRASRRAVKLALEASDPVSLRG